MIILAALLLLFSALPVSAAAQDVTATVRISVCGDLAAEGSEQCDNTDLNGATCRSQGYFAGDLKCNANPTTCEFDESDCYGVAPTPTPTPTPSSTTTTSSTSNTTSTTSTATTPSVIVVPTVTQQIVTATPLLPTTVAFFDDNQDGRISAGEVSTAVGNWVATWVNFMTQTTADQTKSVDTKVCDINLDDTCDLVDLSVLLYHVK